MIFRDVQLLNYGKHSDERLEQNRYLMFYWENLRDIFCINLPNKLDLIGISKLNIQLRNFDGNEYQSPSLDGIATFRRNDFDFDEFCELPDHEKSVKSLYYIEDSLLTVCKKFKAPEETISAIRSAAEAVISSNFEHYRIHKKTTKWNKNRSLRAVTHLHHKNGGIDANLVVTDKLGNIKLKTKILNNQRWEVVWSDLWKGYWKDSSFVIEDRVGKTFSSIDASA